MAGRIASLAMTALFSAIVFFALYPDQPQIEVHLWFVFVLFAAMVVVLYYTPDVIQVKIVKMVLIALYVILHMAAIIYAKEELSSKGLNYIIVCGILITVFAYKAKSGTYKQLAALAASGIFIILQIIFYHESIFHILSFTVGIFIFLFISFERYLK